MLKLPPVLKSILQNRSIRGLAIFLALYFVARMIYWYIWNRHFLTGPEPVVHFLIQTETWIMYHVFALLGLATYTEANLVYFANQQIMAIEDGCSGSGEMIKALIIFILYPGPWRKKLWFIPAMILFVYLAALVHLFLLGLVIALRTEWFAFAHNTGTRIIFYAMFFLIWVAWEEWIRGKPHSEELREKSAVDK